MTPARPFRTNGRGRGVFDGRHRPVGVFIVFHAVGVVPFLSAFARRRTQDLQLPYSVRHGENSDGQSHPFDARPGSSLASAILVRSSDCDAARAWRHERIRAPWRTRADRARWNRIFLLAKARLSAVPNAQAFERQDRILPFDAGGDTRRARPQQVVPLMPEFIAKPDGAEKQDCERNAAKRWLAAHGARMKELRPLHLGDDLFACQPICEAVLASGADFLFTAKPDSHKTLYDFMNGATF